MTEHNEALEARYRFLMALLIDRGVLTDKRYRNGTWSLQGIYGVDDSGLRGAGLSPEQAIDNAIAAARLDPAARLTHWQETHKAIATPAPAQPDPLHVANERGEEWQPIESVPGTPEPVLLWTRAGAVRVETGWYAKNLLDESKEDDFECAFTHWRQQLAGPASPTPEPDHG